MTELPSGLPEVRIQMMSVRLLWDDGSRGTTTFFRAEFVVPESPGFAEGYGSQPGDAVVDLFRAVRDLATYGADDDHG